MPNGIARLNKMELLHTGSLTGTTPSSAINVPADTRYIIIASDSTVPLNVVNDSDGEGIPSITLYPRGTGTAVGIYEEFTLCDAKLLIRGTQANVKCKIEVVRFLTK